MDEYMYYEEIHRLFDPATDMSIGRIPRSELIVYNPDKHVSQLQTQAYYGSAPRRDEFTMVVHIDGACRNNGHPNARAAYGVYFGPSSPYNTCGIVPSNTPQTSTRAEIEAFAEALVTIKRICSNDFRLQQIKIATDSSYLVKAMSQWIEGWIEDGGRKANGTRVKHFERLKQLHEELDEMEYGDDGGIEVQFWHVPREMNREADALANAALDTAG